MTMPVGLTRGFSFSGISVSQTEAPASGLLTILNEDVPLNSTDLAFALTITVAKLKAYYLSADQDMTLEFNSNTVGAPSIALKANIPVIWSLTCGLVSILSVDITALYVTNTTAGTLKCFFLIDPT